MSSRVLARGPLERVRAWLATGRVGPEPRPGLAQAMRLPARRQVDLTVDELRFLFALFGEASSLGDVATAFMEAPTDASPSPDAVCAGLTARGILEGDSRRGWWRLRRAAPQLASGYWGTIGVALLAPRLTFLQTSRGQLADDIFLLSRADDLATFLEPRGTLHDWTLTAVSPAEGIRRIDEAIARGPAVAAGPAVVMAYDDIERAPRADEVARPVPASDEGVVQEYRAMRHRADLVTAWMVDELEAGPGRINGRRQVSIDVVGDVTWLTWFSPDSSTVSIEQADARAVEAAIEKVLIGAGAPPSLMEEQDQIPS